MSPLTPPSLQRALVRHLLGLVAASQATPAIVLHGAWMLLALATWTFAGGDGGGFAEISRPLLRAYRWLGGVDEDGHGDIDGLLTVAGKLALVVYALDLLWRRWRGERRPLAGWVLTLLSGLVAFAGYALALWPTLAVAGADRGGTLFFLLAMTVLATAATAWALAVRHLLDRLAAAKTAPAPGPAREKAA